MPPQYEEADIATREALMTPAELEEYGEIPTEALTAPEPAEPTREQQFADIQAEIQRIAGEFGGVAQRVATEGITTETGEVLVAPTEPIGDEVIDTTQITTDISTSDAYKQFLEDYMKRQETLWGKVKGALGIGAERETAEQIITRIMPEVPTRVGALDTELGRLRLAHKQAQLDIEQRPGVSMFLMGKQQTRAQREYEIQRGELLIERTALMGDYDRAMNKAKMILGLEMEMRQDEREDQRTAINFMMQTASAEEALLLEGFTRTLDRADTMEERRYNEAIKEQSDIKTIAAKDPVAFAKYVAQYGYPKTADELLSRIGEFAPEDVLSVAEAKSLGVPYGTTRQQAMAMGIVSGVGADWSTYFSPDQIRQIARAGIDLSTPEGFTKALEMFPVAPEAESWANAENYIQQNIATGATSENDMATIYTEIKRNTPKLTDSDIKALMAQYGMINMYGMWVYMPPAGMPEVGKPPEEGEEITLPSGVAPGVSPWVGLTPGQIWKGAKWLWGKVAGK